MKVQPVSAGVPGELEPPPAGGVAIREMAAWRATVPAVTSADARIPAAVDQALADLSALRIVDRDHPDRAVVAAGAPWFMTLFGRDSLLTAWMALPFDGSLARGVLETLADLQGSRMTRPPRSSPAASCTSFGGTVGADRSPPGAVLRHRGRHAPLRRSGR